MAKLIAAAVWCVLFGLYLLFAGTVGGTEIGTGLVVATLVTGLMVFLHAGESRHLQLRPPMRVFGQPLVGLVTDSVRVGRVLLHALWRRPAGMAGVVTRQPFRQGGETSADAGRRGLVILSASLAPNGYALQIPRDEDALVMHRLAPVSPSPHREWPV